MRKPYAHYDYIAARAAAREADEKDFEATFNLAPDERRRYYEKKEEEKAKEREELNKAARIKVRLILAKERGLAKERVNRIRSWGGNVGHRSPKLKVEDEDNYFAGVRYDPRYKKPYMAVIDHERIRHVLGRFDTPHEAAAVYQAAREMILAGGWEE